MLWTQRGKIKTPAVSAAGVQLWSRWEPCRIGNGMVRPPVRVVNRELAMPKCAECGFLATRMLDSRQLCEAEIDTRTTGKVPVGSQGKAVYVMWPLCFRTAFDLREECMADSQPGTTSGLSRVLQLERNCPEFTKWNSGLSPREHLEMLHTDAMLKADRDWRDQQARREHEWREEDRRATRTNTWIAFAGIVIAVLVPAFTLLFDWFKPDRPIVIQLSTPAPAPNAPVVPAGSPVSNTVD